MLGGFKKSEIKTSGARIVTVVGGSGPPLLLMHGNPFNHLSWHAVAPTLAKEFTVVATDLRGYGDSEKPPGGDDHSGYSFRAMAQDQVEVMAALGFDQFFAAGHDRGARVLHRMCLDHPGKVLRAAILDIIPQHYLLNHMTKEWGRFSWHWLFNIQPEPLPEKMMGADPDWFIEKKLAKTKQGLGFFNPEALAEYKRCFRNPETIHAVCEDYRATFGVDLDMDTKDFEAGRKIECRCYCSGVRPAASGAITIPARPRSGKATRPISSPRRRCRADTICPRRRRWRRRRRCANSSRRLKPPPATARPESCAARKTRDAGSCCSRRCAPSAAG